MSAEVELEDTPGGVKFHNDLTRELNDGLVEETTGIQNDATADFDKEGFRLSENFDGGSASLTEVAGCISPCPFDKLHFHDASIELALIEISEGVVTKIVNIDKL